MPPNFLCSRGVYVSTSICRPDPAARLTESALTPQWFQILLALGDQPAHGYAVMTEVLERTGGRMRLWPGMLYGSLKRMTEAGLVEEIDAPADAPRDQRERRFYRITRAGRQAAAAEARRLAGYVSAAKAKNLV